LTESIPKQKAMSVRNPENSETPQHEKTFDFVWQS